MSELVYYDMRQTAKMTPSLSIQVARELGRRIVAGSYEPDSLLSSEDELAERYQVSRVVVRDAVKILVGKGMLDVRRGIGTRVRPRYDWLLLDDDVLAWHLSAPPNPDFLQQLTEIRLCFEPKAARWAAERATPEDLAEMAEACSKMEEEKGSVEKFIVADAMFHRSVIRAAHNEFLTAMEGVIFSALLVSFQITNEDPRESEASIPLHRLVFKAISSGNGKRAEQLVEKLLGEASRSLQEKVKKA